MNQLSNIEVFIDPKVKQIDRDVFSELESAAVDSSMTIVTDSSELSKNEFPKIFCLSNSNNENLNEFLADEKNFVLTMKEANLSFFDSSATSPKGVTIASIIDVIEIWPFIIHDMTSYLSQIETEYIANSEARFKKIVSRKNIEELMKSDFSVKLGSIEEEIFSYPNIEDVKTYLTKNSELFFGGELKLLDSGEFFSSKWEDYLTLDRGEGEWFFLCWKNVADEKILGIYSVLKNYFENLEILSDSNRIRKDWDHIFSLLPYPIALFDQHNLLMMHNRRFVGLNLSSKECLELKHNQQVKFEKKNYRVLRINLDQDYTEFLFIPLDEFLGENVNPSSQELGIVSSSIAHELNNPLAGTLAAIDVLLLDDLDEEVETKLLEMKKGISRCQKLVKTFLGFSKMSTKHIERFDAPFSFEESFNQALELVRFRLIENNMNISMNFNQNKKFGKSLNPHVISMALYLIFGEIVTGVSHENLVVGKNKNQICFQVEENYKSLLIKFEQGIKLDIAFFESRLLSHLIDNENLTYFFSDDCLELRSKE